MGDKPIGLAELITIRNPNILKQYGWKAPYPSYVTAAPSLWELWLKDASRRVVLSTRIDPELARELLGHTDPETRH